MRFTGEKNYSATASDQVEADKDAARKAPMELLSSNRLRSATPTKVSSSSSIPDFHEYMSRYMAQSPSWRQKMSSKRIWKYNNTYRTPDKHFRDLNFETALDRSRSVSPIKTDVSEPADGTVAAKTTTTTTTSTTSDVLDELQNTQDTV